MRHRARASTLLAAAVAKVKVATADHVQVAITEAA
jgi:hypothetical protein